MIKTFGFEELFRGLNRAHGIWRKNNTMETAKATVVSGLYSDHLKGKQGLGIVPIREDNTCYFGVIDVDEKDDTKEIDIISLEQQIANLNLPLVTCRSKSGGAHLYLFMEEPINARTLRSTLSKWASALGYRGVEIFPKQVKIGPEQLGNWINLPYFDHKNTNRYAIKNGNKIDLEQFCIEANENKQTIKKLKLATETLYASEEMDGAPPCLIHLCESGIKEGHRNDALFNFALYFKQRGGNWEDDLLQLNYSSTMCKPLAKREVDQISNSVSRAQTYAYKCSQPPLVDHCNKELCLGRKFGVKSFGGEYDNFVVGDLTKILSDPPRWMLDINGNSVEVSSDELMAFRILRRAVVEKLSIMIPPIKDEDWLLMLKPKLEAKLEMDAPDDASMKGQILAMLDDFSSQTEGIKPDRMDIMRGIPIQEKGLVMFRSQDFINFLKRRKSEEAKGAKLWSIMRQCDCGHKKLRVDGIIIQVWTYKYGRIKPKFNNPVDNIEEEF